MSVPKCVKCRELIKARSEGQSTENIKTFKVVTYNILAECHMPRWDYSYTNVDSKYHAIGYRHGIMMAELRAFDGDIICLQEVGPKYFSDTLKPEMNSLGYDGLFVKRKTDHFDEGCATFYRKSTFSLLDDKSFYLGDEAAEIFSKLDVKGESEDDIRQRYIDRVDVLLVLLLKSKTTGSVITVANTHLTWENEGLTDTRALQSRCAKKILSDYIADHPSACLLCGDFNSIPDSLAYMFALGKPLPNDLESSLKPATSKRELIPILKKALDTFPADDLPLKSSYEVVMGREPSITTIDQDNQMTVDYIFYGNNSGKNNLQDSPVTVLDVPLVSTWTDTFPPDVEFPSDHLSLTTEFCHNCDL